MLVAVLALAVPALAQRDPWAGSWRGVLTTPQGDDTNVTITLVAGDDGYTGLVTGFGPGTEIRVSSVTPSDVPVTVEGATDTAFVRKLLSSRAIANTSSGGTGDSCVAAMISLA